MAAPRAYESPRAALFRSHRDERLNYSVHFLTFTLRATDLLPIMFFDGQHFTEFLFAVFAVIFVDRHSASGFMFVVYALPSKKPPVHQYVSSVWIWR
jgi:hypothetical protein